MRYMGNYYWTRTTADLHTLRSKKYNRVSKLRSEAQTYFNLQEIKKLREQMSQIEAVLNARIPQSWFNVD